MLAQELMGRSDMTPEVCVVVASSRACRMVYCCTSSFGKCRGREDSGCEAGLIDIAGWTESPLLLAWLASFSSTTRRVSRSLSYHTPQKQLLRFSDRFVVLTKLNESTPRRSPPATRPPARGDIASLAIDQSRPGCGRWHAPTWK